MFHISLRRALSFNLFNVKNSRIPPNNSKPSPKVILILSVTGVIALAGTITFDFNSLANQASDAIVQNYMNGLLSGTEKVTVTGAIADKTYNGDGHVARHQATEKLHSPSATLMAPRLTARRSL